MQETANSSKLKHAFQFAPRKIPSKLQYHPDRPLGKKTFKAFHLKVHLNSDSCTWNHSEQDWLTKRIRILSDLHEVNEVKTIWELHFKHVLRRSISPIYRESNYDQSPPTWTNKMLKLRSFTL